ncbi:MAG: hypothetical protein HRT57_17905 [Crocinitomicaceae bacterium]|nr:hypothetical protein [Crocinitomicaceae bacterium]
MSFITINENSKFKFPEGADVAYPSAPLVTAKYIDKGQSIIMRIVVFVDVKFIGTLKFTQIQEANPDTFYGLIQYNMDYRNHGHVPSEYRVSYYEFTCSSNKGKITKIDLCLENDDPKTSRGTVTTVQMS